MKSYTNLEQSKELAKILPLDSADMSYTLDFNSEKYYISTTSYKSWVVPKYAESYKGLNQVLPCWSLAALLNVIPKELEIEGQRYAPCLFPVQNKWLLRLWYNANYTITSPIAIFGDNPIDAYYEMILKLKERNLI